MMHTITLDRESTAAYAAYYQPSADRSFMDCRQRLISYLIKLNKSLNGELQDLSQALLSRFCDSLVDYLSAGHFRLFQRAVPMPREYAAIEATTHLAMAFNDRFGQLRSIDIPQVKHALEQLAHQLSTRFELEDHLLDNLHG